ncbi:O-antigen ligase family protein [Streptomyces justiciae]|uniref:O-antigen ligase family protein n=1 Tax=Streptomyces justiciae TaxID=2780140 RepID=A0ABU3LQY8_9ACTN|nr:O-antigen ligase family protein [Streptomyces justiciae]MDT7841630.1 O-antigen ligase family protein [Streptomyces justiciae]
MTTLTTIGRPATVPYEALGRTTAAAACAAMVFQPVLRPAGPGNSAPVDVFTVATVVLSVLWAATCGRRLGVPYGLASALLLLSGAIAGLAGPLPGLSLMNLAREVLLLAWCVALFNIARRPGVLRLLTAAFAYAAVFWASVLVAAARLGVTGIEGVSPTEGDRKLFTLGDPNYAATYWVVSLFMVYAAQRPRTPLVRWYGYAVLLWALLLSQSNGGVLELSVGLLFLAAYKAYQASRARPGSGPVAAGALVLAVVLTVGASVAAAPLAQVQEWARLSDRTELVNTLGRSGTSTDQRSTLVRESLELYEPHWVTGSGPGTTKQLLQDQQFPYAKEAHDDYLAALVERGPLGVVALLALLSGTAWRCSRALRAPPDSGFAAQVPRPAGLVAALAGLAVAGAYYEVLHFRFLWVLLALVAVLASPVDDPATAHEGPP